MNILSIALMRYRIVLLVIFCILSAFVYKSSFSSFFFQDDWFSFRISTISTFSESMSLFLPRTDVIYYRPLGMQIPFFVLQSLTGVNPIPFRLLTYFTHCANIILVYYLVYVITKKIAVGLLSSFSYATSTIHYIPFFWSATYAFVLGPTFFFLALLTFLHYLSKNKIKWYIFSYIIFILGIFTNEMVITFPFILTAYMVLLAKDMKRILLILPFYLSSALMIIGRLFVLRLPTTPDYQMVFGRHVFHHIQAYLLWSLNWPEEMKAQFTHFYTINRQFILDFPFYWGVFFVTFLVFMLLFFLLPFLMMILKRNTINMRLIIFGGLWFILGLLPILFFPKHAFSYYLPISSAGFYILMFTIFTDCYDAKQHKKPSFYLVPLFIFLISWLSVAVVTVDFNSKIHWAPRRARLSDQLIKSITETNNLQLINHISIPASSENKLALNDQDGLRVISGNPNFVTYYENDPE